MSFKEDILAAVGVILLIQGLVFGGIKLDAIVGKPASTVIMISLCVVGIISVVYYEWKTAPTSFNEPIGHPKKKTKKSAKEAAP